MCVKFGLNRHSTFLVGQLIESCNLGWTWSLCISEYHNMGSLKFILLYLINIKMSNSYENVALWFCSYTLNTTFLNIGWGGAVTRLYCLHSIIFAKLSSSWQFQLKLSWVSSIISVPAVRWPRTGKVSKLPNSNKLAI